MQAFEYNQNPSGWGFCASFPFSRLAGLSSRQDVPLDPVATGTCLGKLGIVAWIRDNSNQGAMDPAWGSVFCLPRARAPLGLDVAWLHGFVMAVIKGDYAPHRFELQG